MKKNNIDKELAELAVLKKQVENSLKGAPQGELRCEMARGKYPQYYIKQDEEKDRYPKGRYLKNEESSLAKKLAQRDYDIEMLKRIERRERTLKRLKKSDIEDDLRWAFNKLPEARKRIVLPYIKPDDIMIKEWHEKAEEIKNIYKPDKEYITEKGEIVRSKSEKMIADKLYYRNIPYIYEKPLKLSGNRIVYPDFTVLNINTRETYYYEHFGMMDDNEYCKNALDKIGLYSANDICIGEKLIVTFESSAKGIDMKQLEKYIDKYLI